MELGFIGLGKMGENMVERLLSGGHNIIANDLNKDAIKRVETDGATAAYSVEELVSKMRKPRMVWSMVPSGNPTAETIDLLISLMTEGDTIIDGGNSYYKDSVERAKRCAIEGINFVDVGTSGGIWGLKAGYCMMIGGDRKVFERLKPIFETLAPEDGYLYIGKEGSGHYVKMIHNGIEYGMLQACAEGFALLEKSDFDLSLEQISHLWNNGSVIRSWLLELAELAFRKNADLDGIKAYVEDSGEARWTVMDSLEKDIPCPVITHSLLYRLRSRQEEPFAAKVIAALRNEFGGHEIKR